MISDGKQYFPVGVNNNFNSSNRHYSSEPALPVVTAAASSSEILHVNTQQPQPHPQIQYLNTAAPGQAVIGQTQQPFPPYNGYQSASVQTAHVQQLQQQSYQVQPQPLHQSATTMSACGLTQPQLQQVVGRYV